MISIERLLKTLNGEIPDRIPWAPAIEYNFLNAQKKEIRNLGIIGISKKLNIDIIAKNTVSSYRGISKNVRTKTYINGEQVNIPKEEKNWQQEIFTMFSLYKYRDPYIKIIDKYFKTPLEFIR